MQECYYALLCLPVPISLPLPHLSLPPPSMFCLTHTHYVQTHIHTSIHKHTHTHTHTYSPSLQHRQYCISQISGLMAYQQSVLLKHITLPSLILDIFMDLFTSPHVLLLFLFLWLVFLALPYSCGNFKSKTRHNWQIFCNAACISII